jgi:hypothetical protein
MVLESPSNEVGVICSMKGSWQPIDFALKSDLANSVPGCAFVAMPPSSPPSHDLLPYRNEW